MNFALPWKNALYWKPERLIVEEDGTEKYAIAIQSLSLQPGESTLRSQSPKISIKHTGKSKRIRLTLQDRMGGFHHPFSRNWIIIFGSYPDIKMRCQKILSFESRLDVSMSSTWRILKFVGRCTRKVRCMSTKTKRLSFFREMAIPVSAANAKQDQSERTERPSNLLYITSIFEVREPVTIQTVL